MEIYSTINERKRQTQTIFYMHWIKAHAGVPGNERVDYRAKMATELPDCTDERVATPSLSLSMLRRNIRKALAPPHEIDGGGAHRAIRHGIPPRVIEKALAKLPRGICSPSYSSDRATAHFGNTFIGGDIGRARTAYGVVDRKQCAITLCSATALLASVVRCATRSSRRISTTTCR